MLFDWRLPHGSSRKISLFYPVPPYLKELDVPLNLQLVFELGGKTIRIFRKSKALWKTQRLDPKKPGWKKTFLSTLSFLVSMLVNSGLFLVRTLAPPSSSDHKNIQNHHSHHVFFCFCDACIYTFNNLLLLGEGDNPKYCSLVVYDLQ